MNTAKAQLMLSYQWDNQKQVLEIANALKELGFEIWIDVEKMSGDIFDKMAQAVEGSTIVLICMTSKYEKSANCKRELNYAVEKKKKLIPIYVEKDYAARGSLGLIIAGKLYFDFTDGNRFKENIENLKNEIENQIREQGMYFCWLLSLLCTDILHSTSSYALRILLNTKSKSLKPFLLEL